MNEYLAPGALSCLDGQNNRNVPTDVLTAIAPGYLEGIIVGAPTVLREEGREVEPLQSFVVVLLLLETLFVFWLISAYLFLGAVLLLALAVVLGVNSGAGGGAIRRAIIFPYSLISAAVGRGQTASTVPPGPLGGQAGAGVASPPQGRQRASDPANIRVMWRYDVERSDGSESHFVVKSRTTVPLLRVGDYVRVWLTERNGEFHLRSGLRCDAGIRTWAPIRATETPIGVYWLLGFIGWTSLLLVLFALISA
jgi:hypothetical protein